MTIQPSRPLLLKAAALLLAASWLLAGCAVPQAEPAAPGSVSESAAESVSERAPEAAASPTPSDAPATPEEAAEQKIIVIDAGHQAHANLEQEPVGPGASETKYKVAGGTSGVTSGTPEYEVPLEISLALEAELQARNYTVVMVRDSSDVDISNAERAAIANEIPADVFLRIHCNGSTNQSQNGAMTLCQTRNNPYNKELYEQSSLLANCVLDALVQQTGCRREYVWETDTMAGINWSQVPVTLVEVGYLTNPSEESRLIDPDYQELVAQGIANGVDDYFAQTPS